MDAPAVPGYMPPVNVVRATKRFEKPSSDTQVVPMDVEPELERPLAPILLRPPPPRNFFSDPTVRLGRSDPMSQHFSEFYRVALQKRREERATRKRRCDNYITIVITSDQNQGPPGNSGASVSAPKRGRDSVPQQQ
ncbi:hypothetical protein L596_002043 [Steinernema carpocapsae]|uniref:Uncharacterized protein n=1 Tax=Steinernema carpocapsae TaxID=34508 RepID=A0A4U8UNA8_STECR|nr:hypothetical protein L596_002043 [Steinernema carpocapsae]